MSQREIGKREKVKVMEVNTERINWAKGRRRKTKRGNKCSSTSYLSVFSLCEFVCVCVTPTTCFECVRVLRSIDSRRTVTIMLTMSQINN